MARLEGRLIYKGVLKAKEAGKSDRKVFQLLERPGEFYNLALVSDMSKEGVQGKIGEFVSIRAQASEYKGAVQWTYWGDGADRDDSLSGLFGGNGVKADEKVPGSANTGKSGARVDKDIPF
jgi:hypothetical protein